MFVSCLLFFSVFIGSAFSGRDGHGTRSGTRKFPWMITQDTDLDWDDCTPWNGVASATSGVRFRLNMEEVGRHVQDGK